MFPNLCSRTLAHYLARVGVDRAAGSLVGSPAAREGSMRKVLVVAAAMAVAFGAAACSSRVFHTHHSYCDLTHRYVVPGTVLPACGS